MCAECAADPGRFTGDSDVATIRAFRVVFAAAAARSPVVYCRSANAVAARLGSALRHVNGLSPAELARHFVEGRDVLSTEELEMTTRWRWPSLPEDVNYRKESTDS